MGSDRDVRRFDNRTEWLANPQGSARMWGGKPVTHTGYILPYGRGGYRHNFGGCGCAGGLGDGGGATSCADNPTLPGCVPPQEMSFMAWVLLLGLGGWLAYSLLRK